MVELASRQDSSAVEPGNRYPNNDVLVQDGLAFLVGNSGDVNVASARSSTMAGPTSCLHMSGVGMGSNTP